MQTCPAYEQLARRSGHHAGSRSSTARRERADPPGV